MPHDRAAVPTHQPARINVPVQLQQAKQSEAPRRTNVSSDQDAAQTQPAGGILQELQSERAHD